MSYIGNTPTTQSFTAAVDFFNGNGSTTAFTLSRPVASVAQVQVAIENVPQNPGDAFTVSGNTITFTSAPPSGTNNIYVYYTSPITQVIAPGQGTVGTAQIQEGAVITADIANGAVTTAKLSSTTGTGAVALASLPSFTTTIGVGGATASASGSGISFPATQSASTDANTLDDYEEGTYTPTVVTATGTPSYSYQEGFYVKVGRLVYCGGIIGISNSASLTGAISVTLPFTVRTSTFQTAGGITVDGSGFTWPINGGYSMNLEPYSGTTYMIAIVMGASPNNINYNSGGVANSWYFRFSCTYFASA
jgi:hypothetical protein